jgi:EAL domain-containing protein (putative c-di-GMP-specific phosphodiesterase class I)
MVQDSKIITFPAATAAGTSHQHEASADAMPAVIDFASHRRATNANTAATAVERATRELTTDEVWDALNDNRLLMHYQPQYDMRTGKTVAAEALVRLVDRDGQLVGADCFIELAEQSDLIAPLGRAVIEQVCSDLASFRADGNDIGRVAINLSARQLNIDTTLPSFIDQMVDNYGLKYGDLEFELTERQGLGPQCAGLAVLDALAQRGTRIIIDDFGIGYSSIAYLAELPVSAFKLDRALVNRLPEDKTMQTLVNSRPCKTNTSSTPVALTHRALLMPGRWTSLTFKAS